MSNKIEFKCMYPDGEGRSNLPRKRPSAADACIGSSTVEIRGQPHRAFKQC